MAEALVQIRREHKELWRLLKAKAAREGKTIKQVLLEILERALVEERII